MEAMIYTQRICRVCMYYACVYVCMYVTILNKINFFSKRSQQDIMNQGASEDAIVFVFCRPSAAGHAAYTITALCSPSETPLGETIFFCKWLSI